MKYIVDRIEKNFAVCEDENKKMIDISLEFLPKNIKEGTVLYYKNGKYEIDKIEEQQRIDRIKKKIEDIWNN